MKRIGLKLLMVLLAGFLLLLPATGGWADDDDEAPVDYEEVAEVEPGLALSTEEETADYTGETEEAWEEGESAQ